MRTLTSVVQIPMTPEMRAQINAEAALDARTPTEWLRLQLTELLRRRREGIPPGA